MEAAENKPYKLIADIAVFTDSKVLLVKYQNTNKYDHQKGWFLPDDKINYLEHPEDAAIRILSEQLGLMESNVMLNHVESFSGNDKSWHLVFHYRVNIKDETEIKISTDIERYEFFALEGLPDKNEVAHHGWALYTINDMKV